jgi:hypothetical protein
MPFRIQRLCAVLPDHAAAAVLLQVVKFGLFVCCLCFDLLFF